MYQGNLKKGIELEMVKHTESNKDFSQQVDLEKFSEIFSERTNIGFVILHCVLGANNHMM